MADVTLQVLLDTGQTVNLTGDSVGLTTLKNQIESAINTSGFASKKFEWSEGEKEFVILSQRVMGFVRDWS